MGRSGGYRHRQTGPSKAYSAGHQASKGFEGGQDLSASLPQPDSDAGEPAATAMSTRNLVDLDRI